MPPGAAEKYVFRRFRYRLPEVLQELYFVATKEGKIKTLKEANKWLNEQERVDAPQVAAKRWKSIKLQHDGREIRLRDWRDFRGHRGRTGVRGGARRLWYSALSHSSRQSSLPLPGGTRSLRRPSLW